MSRGANRGGGGNSGDRRDDPEHRGHRRPYVSRHSEGVLYGGPGYGAFGSIDPYPLGYPDTTGADGSAAAPNNDAGGYDAQPDEQGPPPYPGPYPPASDLSQPSATQERDESVTLIFKDGRPAEQIHNYILTRATLFVGDSQRREIPTEQLDLAATARVNQDAGVDFRLPDAPR